MNITSTELASAQAKRDEMLEAFNRDDWDTAIACANAIGTVYAPDDMYAADRISYAVHVTASDFYFGGIQDQIEKSRYAS